jgi:hypothetical protein
MVLVDLHDLAAHPAGDFTQFTLLIGRRLVDPSRFEPTERGLSGAFSAYRVVPGTSDFNPKQRTGSYIGLFQLSNAEFQQYGSGDILDPRDNAVAAAYKFLTEDILFEISTHKKPSLSDIYLIHQQGVQGAARRSCTESDIGEPNSYRHDYLGVMMISTAASGPRTSLSPA